MNARIVKKLDGRYWAEVRYQDDQENHFFASEDEARRWCRDSERNSNGNRHVRKRDIPLYEERAEVVTATRLVPVRTK